MALANRIAPSVTLAQELGAFGADAGANKGTYVELAIGPSWTLAGGKVTVATPVKVGLSANNYYEHPVTGEDNRFGFLDVGVAFTVPLTGVPATSAPGTFTSAATRSPLARRRSTSTATRAVKGCSCSASVSAIEAVGTLAAADGDFSEVLGASISILKSPSVR